VPDYTVTGRIVARWGGKQTTVHVTLDDVDAIKPLEDPGLENRRSRAG
jgi:hypothetical protein